MDLRRFLIPAIDISHGRVVRLYKGDFSSVKEYPYEPQEVARIFQEAGFQRLHVVDLDGAEAGKPENLEYIKKIRSVFKGRIEVGGGLRSYSSVKVLFDEGIDYAVIGTLAIKNPDEFERIIGDFPERIILSIDSRGGKVAVGGWKEASSLTPQELAGKYDHQTIWGYLYTIIERDGSLEGVDVRPYREIKSAVKKPVIASGGVSSVEDVKRLYGLVEGVVVGKAIYEGWIPVEGLKL